MKQTLGTALPAILSKRKLHPTQPNWEPPRKGTPGSPYPTPVEGSGKVIPSAKGKDSHRRWGAELQLIEDGQDPAHL